jgi:hypothetical protein
MRIVGFLIVIINQHRINNLSAHLPDQLLGKRLRVIQIFTPDLQERLQKIGFELPIEAGMSVLPSKCIGPVARFNAEGRSVVRTDLPKESACRPHYWTRTEYRGRDRVEVSDVVYIHYQRYPRDFIPPAEIRLVVGTTPDGGKTISSPVYEYGSEDHKLLTAINLHLECFGSCVIATEDSMPVRFPVIRRLDWDVLPPGEYPWAELRERTFRSLSNTKPSSRAVIQQRLETINAYQPDFYAVGKSGFSGYIVLGFKAIGLYFLECQRIDNATYVFGSNWESLSQLTKRDILVGDLHEHRLIHGPTWPSQVHQLLRNRPDQARNSFQPSLIN